MLIDNLETFSNDILAYYGEAFCMNVSSIFVFILILFIRRKFIFVLSYSLLDCSAYFKEEVLFSFT